MTANAETKRATAPVITIEPIPGGRGRKTILVDGVAWGRIHMELHGVRGADYWFEQIGKPGTIDEPPQDGVRGHGRTVKVPGEKQAARDAAYLKQPAPAPLAERLHAMTADLVARGLLRDPDVVKSERDARSGEYRKREEAREQARRDADLARARDIIAIHSGAIRQDAATQVEALTAAIADALDRARSQ